MSQAEQERLVYQLPPRLRHQHIYTQDEVVDMFAECERNESGDIVFQAFAEYANYFFCKSLCVLFFIVHFGCTRVHYLPGSLIFLVFTYVSFLYLPLGTV
jgi:hypothetical protein